MKHIKEHEVEGERFPPPHARVIKHLAAPWTLGTQNLWVGVSKVDPGSSSNMHAHDDMEEIFYVISGHGKIRVGDEEEPIEPGSCIYMPLNTPHQLINTSDETLKVLATTSPPFIPDKFKAIHH
jgi:mannose-6-phosphate isomerase-like protein (cupin superfamily)